MVGRGGGSVAGMGTALAYGGLAGLTRTLGSGYQGPPALTVARAFTQWTLDPWMLALVLILGGGYLAGARRQPGWPVARRIWFLGLGLGFLVIATMSWVGVYQPVLFYARAVQTVLLVLVVPLFLTLGRPISLAIAVFPRAGARLEAVIRSRPARILTFPAITAFALVAVPFVMYFTSWYTAVFHSAAVRELTYLALLAAGFAFFWTLLRVDPVPKEYSYAVSMWITGAQVIGDAFLGHCHHRRPEPHRRGLLPRAGPAVGAHPAGGPGHRRGSALDPRRPRRIAVPGRAADPADARGRVRRDRDRR